MNGPVDRDLVLGLLEDKSLSYREVARRASCSDFSVRSIARRASGDSRPMKSRAAREEESESLGIGGWLVVAGMFVVPAIAVWFASRKRGIE